MATPATGIEAKRALDELYRAHASQIYRYVYAVLGNRADAEDVVQTTFVNALRALERGDVPRKPENWLITIAHNLVRQRFRQQSLRPRQVELDGEIPMVEADGSGPSIDDLVRALQRIPEAQREALVLRELDGRSYKEIAAILGVTVSALQALLFRARRSLAEELENLVTCDRAELALSQQADGRLGRKERRRLVAHLEECPSCARVAAISMKRRRAFKGLALLPLPWSLTLFKAPSASAAVGLPTIGAGAAAGGTAAGVVGGGVAMKVAVGFAAVAVAGGAGYEGVRAVRGPAEPAKAAAAAVTPDPDPAPVVRREPPAVAVIQPTVKKPRPLKRAPVKASARGPSAAAPGQTKPVAKERTKPAATRKPRTVPQRKATPNQRPVQAAAPQTAPGRAKSETARSRPQRLAQPKPAKPAKPEKKSPARPERPARRAQARGVKEAKVLPEVAEDRGKGPRP